jgi:hypothetical protein
MDSATPNTPAKPMDEVALIAAIDDSDNRSYGSNLSNLTAALSADYEALLPWSAPAPRS